eukprot:333848-Karenia_brevis.AAC.1
MAIRFNGCNKINGRLVRLAKHYPTAVQGFRNLSPAERVNFFRNSENLFDETLAKACVETILTYTSKDYTSEQKISGTLMDAVDLQAHFKDKPQQAQNVMETANTMWHPQRK